MTRTEVRISLPTWLRIYTVVFGILWCGGLVVVAMVGLFSDGSTPAPVVLMPLLMSFLGGALLYRQSQLGARSDGDLLVVRNLTRTLELQRADIGSFRIGTGPMPFAEAIFVLPLDGEITSIDATMRLQLSLFGKDRHPAQLDELYAWLGGR